MELLAGKETVSLMTGSVPAVKELLEKCLAAGIPAMAQQPPTKTKG